MQGKKEQGEQLLSALNTSLKSQMAITRLKPTPLRAVPWNIVYKN